MIKVALIDNKQNQYDELKEIFKQYPEYGFELVRDRLIYSSDEEGWLTHDMHKDRILHEIEGLADIDLILCDLVLRDKEEDATEFDITHSLSIDIFKTLVKKKPELKSKFVFVTSHPKWRRIKFYHNIPGAIDEGWLHLNKWVVGDESYPNCLIIDSYILKEPICSEDEMIECPHTTNSCFLRRLHKICQMNMN